MNYGDDFYRATTMQQSPECNIVGEHHKCPYPDICACQCGHPTYKHDCKNCTFLGTVEASYLGASAVETYDLYICVHAQKPCLSSIVARYNDDGSEYISSLLSIAESPARAAYGPRDPINMAYNRAKARGLI